MTVTSIGRVEIERREQEILAPYAAQSAKSLGRTYPQPEHPLRTCFQRDRDRIVHCSAFRRMEYKTQVFLPHEGDHYRTRLTHTIEVAQISRTMARCLRLNEDLAEAIALAHDLGHTPFGHAGEDVLDDLLANCGGFNHNNQSLRVVELLEQRYIVHPGLNLSYEVREGIVKHETKVKISRPEFDPRTRPTLEASLVDVADEIAYNAHDVDDGLYAGILTLESLRELPIWNIEGLQNPFETSGALKNVDEGQRRYLVVRYLIEAMITDVLQETARQIEHQRITDMESLRHARAKVARYSGELEAQVKELKSFLRTHLYRHPYLQTMIRRAREIIENLFARFMADPSRIPDRFQEMLLTESKEIVIADYIAGMTDRYAEKLFSEQ
jgi:dGTPase